MIYNNKFSKVLHDLVQQGLDSGEIKPIRVDKVFVHSDLKDAIRYMASGNHIGKIIIDMNEKNNLDNATRLAYTDGRN